LGDEVSEFIQFSDLTLGIYKKLVLSNNRVIGAVLYGDTIDGAWYQQLLDSKQDIVAIRDKLIFGQAYAEQQESNL